MAAVLVIAIVLVFKTFNGDFGDHIAVSVKIAQVGDSLDNGDIVTYRDIIVGEVTSFAPDRSGGAMLHLSLHSDLARQVPSNVTALAVPANLFGATQVLLLPQRTPSSRSLHAGQLISPDSSPAAAGLQTALADAYNLLVAVHPAQLDAALTALATAISGQGADLGNLVRRADDYLRAVQPFTPELDRTVADLATVADEVSRQAPQLLATLGNLLVPARGILREKDAVARLFDIAPVAVDNATQLFNRTSANFITVVTNEVPFLQAAAAIPDISGQLIRGLKGVTDAVNSSTYHGRLKVEAVFRGINVAGIFQVFSGGGSAVLTGVSNPPQYTSADCPRYPGANGPNCGATAATGDSVAALSTRRVTGSEYSAVGGAEEAAVVKAYIAEVTGLPPASIADGMGAYVGPLLRGVVTVIK